MPERRIERVIRGRMTRDGAGVRLRRVFGVGTEQYTDPFLLLDDVGSENPMDYMAGFPPHPHRGIDTVTYMLAGFFQHTDSLGNTGMLGPGDLQWMTAGSGIIHEEMPLESAQLRGFQLWVNLPRSEKMKDPVYRGAAVEEIPVVPINSGKVRVLAGAFGGAKGPIVGVARGLCFLDIELEPNAVFALDTLPGNTVLVYAFEGEIARIGQDLAEDRGKEALLLSDGDHVRIEADAQGSRLLLVSGKPLRDAIAWKGPIVMNTSTEVDLAYKEYSRGTFIKVR